MERLVPEPVLRAIRADLTRALSALDALWGDPEPVVPDGPTPLPAPLPQPTPLGLPDDGVADPEVLALFHEDLAAAVAAQLPTIPPPSPADSAALFDAIPLTLSLETAIPVILGALAKIEAEADVKTTPWRLLGGWLRKIGWQQLSAEIAAWQARQQQSPLGREATRRREAATLAATKPPPRPPTALPALTEIEALRRRLAASRDEVLGGAT